jgi:SAM-dependent methyltransferase
MVEDVWALGEAYEAYVGRWSRKVAAGFLRWLDAPSGGDWLDVGCGTGALASTALDIAAPARLVGVDPSVGFLAHARSGTADARLVFAAGDARRLPLPDRRFDVVTSGLALNFVPDTQRAAAEIARVTAPGGVAAAYVWDYTDGMVMMRYFWDAAADVDPAVAALDEGLRFPICQPEPLRELWAGAGLTDVTVEPVDIPTVFADFDDYWTPFLGGQGAAPAYLMAQPEDRRVAIRDVLRDRLPVDTDGQIPLTARAWAVRGTA